MHLNVCASKIGFTLAEVLITLGIIGVVAALTLPTLIQNYQEKATVTAVKKYYSILSQALMMARNEKGDFVASSTDSNDDFYKYILPYLKVQKACDKAKGCFPDVVIKHLNGENWVNLNNQGNYQGVILSDGAVLQLYNPLDGSNKAEIRVDVNGFNAPNTMGKDIFHFNVKNNKVEPSGMDKEEVVTLFDNNCKRNSTSIYSGIGCAVWVLFNENMDYLHCDDLSMNGKTKCK